MIQANRPCAAVVRQAAKAAGVENMIDKITHTKATLYVWVKVPYDMGAMRQLADALYPLWDDGHRRVKFGMSAVSVNRIDYHVHPPANGAAALHERR